MIEILKENRSVNIYINLPMNITINDFLEIEKDKYLIYLAKTYDLINNKDIESIYNIMPTNMKKNYVFKKINREAYNKNVRFKKED